MFLLKFITETLRPAKYKRKSNYVPLPGEIRQSIKNLFRCSHCHFLIFDNYWSNEIQKSNVKLCPTCGNRM